MKKAMDAWKRFLITERQDYDRDELIDMIRDYSKELTGKRDSYGSFEKLNPMSDDELMDYYQGMSDSPEQQYFDDEEVRRSDAELGQDDEYDMMPQQSGMGRGMREADYADKWKSFIAECWDGYERVPGTKEGEKGSCRKKTNEAELSEGGSMAEYGAMDAEQGLPPTKIGRGNEEYMAAYNAVLQARGEEPLDIQQPDQKYLDALRSGQLQEDEEEEGEICKAGKDYVDGKEIGGQVVKRGEDGKFDNWSARAAQIASNYCKNPDYGKGRGKDAKDEQLTNEGGLEDWEKENWTHSDGTPCGGGDKDGSQSRCKPASKWKTMSKGEKAADNAKKKAGTESGKQYVSATKKGKVTKSHTKEAIESSLYRILSEGGGCGGEPAPMDYDEGPEASMHRTSLAVIANEVQDLLAMIRDADDLPEWVEAKITKAKASLSAAKDYIAGEQARELGALEEALDEVVYIEEGGKCDGPTKKASSTAKGKKWMQCVKNPDGKGYKRVHWGQKGVRATGDSGNTKRKKSFRKRHKCSSAKAGTPRAQACKDW